MSSAGAGHITNYAQNENGDVWDLQQLATHMGRSVWQVRVGAIYCLLRSTCAALLVSATYSGDAKAAHTVQVGSPTGVHGTYSFAALLVSTLYSVCRCSAHTASE
jgi:hypothetical protein